MPYPKKTLGELTSFVASGITPRGGNATYVESGPQLVRSQNVLMGSLSLENVARINPEIYESMHRVRVLFDDVLLNITGASIGRVCRVAVDLGEAVVNQHVAIIRTHKNILSPAFLSYAMRTDRLQQTILSGQTGAAQGGFNHQKIRALEIPLPPLPEQHRIVEILDQADTLRQQRRQADALSQRILPALFQEMFGGCGFPEATLESVSEGKDGVKCGPFGTQLSKSEFRETGVPLWGIKHVNRGFSKPTDEFITAEKAAELSAYLLVAGDIVMTRKGTIGNAHIYPANFSHGMMHSDLLRIRANHSIMTSEFLYAQLVFSESVKLQISSGSTGAVMPGINVGKLKQTQLTVPPLDQQKVFSGLMQVIADYTPSQSTSAATLETLFQTLLHRAFDGSLTAKWREGQAKEVLQEMEHQPHA